MCKLWLCQCKIQLLHLVAREALNSIAQGSIYYFCLTIYLGTTHGAEFEDDIKSSIEQNLKYELNFESQREMRVSSTPWRFTIFLKNKLPTWTTPFVILHSMKRFIFECLSTTTNTSYVSHCVSYKPKAKSIGISVHGCSRMGHGV